MAAFACKAKGERSQAHTDIQIDNPPGQLFARLQDLLLLTVPMTMSCTSRIRRYSLFSSKAPLAICRQSRLAKVEHPITLCYPAKYHQQSASLCVIQQALAIGVPSR